MMGMSTWTVTEQVPLPNVQESLLGWPQIPTRFRAPRAVHGQGAQYECCPKGPYRDEDVFLSLQFLGTLKTMVMITITTGGGGLMLGLLGMLEHLITTTGGTATSRAERRADTVQGAGPFRSNVVGTHMNITLATLNSRSRAQNGQPEYVQLLGSPQRLPRTLANEQRPLPLHSSRKE